MSKKSVLITDLDNTLFDWFELWVQCFSAMLNSVVEQTGIPKDTLLPEFAAVHQRHGTSEYSFVLEELPSLQPFLKGRPAPEVFADAVQKYQIQRRKYLLLFPTVGETLLKIKGRGAKIVGYTESMAFYSNYRIRRLGLDGVLDYLFCPEDHQLPDGIAIDQIRRYPAQHYALKHTKQDFTPNGSQKPDAVVLDTIIGSLRAEKDACVYVGDSIMKDVAMAHDCGVEDAWASYGVAHNRAEYKLLQDVTHWTKEDVQREQEIKAREHVMPTHTLEKSFSEILDIFEFTDFHE